MRAALAVCCLGAFCVACPSVETTQAQITSASLVGSAAAPTYTIHVVGRGFAPSALEYSLSSGTGRGDVDLFLEIFRTTDGAMTASSSVVLLSTRELDARPGVVLPPALYGVRLMKIGVEAPLAVLDAAFEVPGDQPPMLDDAGLPITHPDATPGEDAVVVVPPDADVDGGVVVQPDAAEDGGVVVPPDDAMVFPDAEVDAGVADTGEPPDLGVAPDSGLGPFVGNYSFRQEVRLFNNSNDVAPIGVSFLVPVPHADLLAAGSASADASDVALYYGTVRLQHAWEDRQQIGTNNLIMIAQLPEQILSGTERNRTTPLVLYYGDPAVGLQPSDGVFVFAERFDNTLNANWTTRVWARCNWDRSSELMTAAQGAYCVDDAAGEQRITLSSPRIAAMDQVIAGNLVYVFSFFLSGLMAGANDLVYFAVDDAVAQYDQTIQLAATAWTEFAPNGSQTFQEINNFGLRTVSGWRLPGTRMNWTRATARFQSPVEDPSLQVRFLSIDANDLPATFVALDDYTVRLALDVELLGTLDPAEGRN